MQRSLRGTLFRAYSMCSPQPSQVGLPHVAQAISWHMVVTSLLLRQRGRSAEWLAALRRVPESPQRVVGRGRESVSAWRALWAPLLRRTSATIPEILHERKPLRTSCRCSWCDARKERRATFRPPFVTPTERRCLVRAELLASCNHGTCRECARKRKQRECERAPARVRLWKRSASEGELAADRIVVIGEKHSG